MKKLLTLSLVVLFLGTANAQTDKAATSDKKVMTEKEHKCGSSCADGKHMFKHGEKGHACSAECMKAHTRAMEENKTQMSAEGVKSVDEKPELMEQEKEQIRMKEKSEMHEMKEEVKEEIKEMKGEVKEMKGEVKEMKGEVKEMKGEVKEMKSEVKEEKMEMKGKEGAKGSGASTMKGSSNSKAPMKAHACTPMCKNGSHAYIHGEKGHKCSAECKALHGISTDQPVKEVKKD